MALAEMKELSRGILTRVNDEIRKKFEWGGGGLSTCQRGGTMGTEAPHFQIIDTHIHSNEWERNDLLCKMYSTVRPGKILGGVHARVTGNNV